MIEMITKKNDMCNIYEIKHNLNRNPNCQSYKKQFLQENYFEKIIDILEYSHAVKVR